MNSVFKRSVAAVAVAGCLAALPVTASANLPFHDFGTLTTQVTGPNIDFTGSFEDLYRFVDSAPYLEANGFVGGLAITNAISVEYAFKAGNAMPTWTPGDWTPLTVNFDSNAGTFSAATTFLDLTPGITYWIGLKGVTDPVGDSGTYSLTLAPVPEPENWALMLSGLALMGYVARRRNTLS